MDIDYNKLKSFLTVIQCGSVTAAAKVLHRTQSAVSQALHVLEQNLGFTLIKWEGKCMKLTREGQLVYRAIHDRMAAIDEQLSTIIQAGEEVGGCIEIGMLQDHSTRIQEYLFQVIAMFRKKYPSVIFNIHFGTSVEIEQALLEQKLDIGFLINFRERHRFHVFEVVTEEHIVVTSTGYLKQSGPIDHLNDLIGADLIDIDESFTCLSTWLQKNDPGSIQVLDKKNPVIVVPDFKVVRKLILLGLGIGVVPRYLVEGDLKSGELVKLLPKQSVLKVGVDCAVPGGRRERLCETLFIEAICEGQL